MRRGNQRWVTGDLEHPHQTVARREETSHHQDPFAVVFSCIDSRVPPEIVFDRGIGDLFVIRTGAQVLDRSIVLGSIEFGPNGYNSQLIVVLGHSECGAVIAAIGVFEGGDPPPGHIGAVVDALRPAYLVAKPEPGSLVDNMVRAQVRLTVAELKSDPLLAKLMVEKGLRIVGGHYDLFTGVVDIIA
ncbi:MAG TPA: carbonic anhydrase [Streptosporangiaceae bacterium]